MAAARVYSWKEAHLNRANLLVVACLLLVLALTFSVDHFVRREIAKTYVEFIDRFLTLGDYRETALIINSRYNRAFTAVSLRDADQQEIFHLPPEHLYKTQFEGRIRLESPNTKKIIMFWYDLWFPTALSLLIMGLFGILGRSWQKARESRIRVAAFMERKVEIANLITQVSHDIRSPLTALNLAVRGMAAADSERRDVIISASRRINDIAESLLQHLKPRVEPTSEEPVLLEKLLTQVLNEKRVEFSGRNVVLVSQMPDESIPARVNTLNLVRVISNLINNAIEAGSTEVRLTLVREEQTILLKIQDNGPGISKDIISRLGRDPISVGKEGGAGFGIGLWSAYIFAHRCGGKLRISSSKTGTTVSFTMRI